MLYYPNLATNSKQIGVFGGSFNPLHLGHLEMVSILKKQKLVEELIIIPNYQNPLEKKKYLDVSLRWKILKTVFQKDAFFHLWDYEIRQTKPSYFYKTLELLKAEFKKKQFYLILGSDSFAKITQWQNYSYIIANTKFIIFQRADNIPITNLQLLIEYHLVNKKITNISSSSIIKQITDYSVYINKLQNKFNQLING